MLFQRSPVDVLRDRYPDLYSILKDGGWHYQSSVIYISPDVWDSLSPILQDQAERWADAVGVRSPVTDKRERDLANAKSVPDLIKALTRG